MTNREDTMNSQSQCPICDEWWQEDRIERHIMWANGCGHGQRGLIPDAYKLMSDNV